LPGLAGLLGSGRVSIGSFMIRRLGSGLFAILGVSVLVFLLLHLTPGDPVDQLAGGEATPEQRVEIERCMNLHEPLWVQFGIFVKNIGNGTLGNQCPNPKDKPTVMARILEVMPYTIELALAGMLVAVLFALPLGIIAALRRGTWVDASAAVISISGLSIPIMWLGPILLSIFFAKLAWLPGPANHLVEPGAGLALLLPAIVIGTNLMAMLARMTRSSLVEVLREDYMTTARAKGLSETVVIMKHGLRNALLPVITVAGLQFGGMLSGAIITEKIFARPGLGTLLLEGIQERNYPIVQGTVLVIAAAYVLVNIMVDLAYGLADPRIRRG
jgi:ABC-type dipeptide/oligopeptide/nickel transport system permease component